MAEQKEVKEAKVYSKNYYLPGLAISIGGKEVSQEIDKELGDLLKAVNKKASDYHATKKEYDLQVELSKRSIGIVPRKKKESKK